MIALKTVVVPSTDAAAFAIRGERASDAIAREALLDACFGDIPALLLGPLAVDDTCRKLGVGAALMAHALAAAEARGHRAVILLGDAPYYARFGFSAQKASRLSLPGPFERDRLLGLELCEGALDGAAGLIAPTGVWLPKLKAAQGRNARRASLRAA
jgi:hypothetical protein